MPLSAQQIKEKLQSAIDQDANVVDMGHVLEAIHLLERTFIPKESLEETRLGKLVNDIRKKSTDRELTNRCRKLVRQWQKQHLKNSNGSSSNSPQVNQRTPSSSTLAVNAATSKPNSSDAVCSVQGGAPTQVSIDKTNPANRKKRKIDLLSPRDSQTSAKHVKTTQVYDSSNGIPTDSNRPVAKAKTSEIKHKQVPPNQKLLKQAKTVSSPSTSVSSASTSVSKISPHTSHRTLSPSISSLENAKKIPRVQSSNSLGRLECSKSSPSLSKSERSPSLNRSKKSPKSSSSPRSNKYGKGCNAVSPALSESLHKQKHKKTSLPIVPSQSIFDEELEVKTTSIFDKEDNSGKSVSIFDDDNDSTVGSFKNDEGLLHAPSLFNDNVLIDATICKNNQDCFDKSTLLSTKQPAEELDSYSQIVFNNDCHVNVLRTNSFLESNVETSISSCSMNTEDAVIKTIDMYDEPVHIVTEGEIDRIHTTEWAGVNGCYDSDHNWRSWSDSYSISVNSNDDNALHILPYVCLE
ncbi:uncharacterized protein [Antedon mediterranea]|uniref:uncharacterized protein n=1 Tax=Antedon mediterranea TaxID=105859 RepID=UPI003AF6003A